MMPPERWPWEDMRALAAVAAALGKALGHEGARVVGGAVRDALLGLPVHDIDLATPAPPAAMAAALRAGGIKVVPTGVAHGTVTAVAEGRPFEITTLRRDVATDGRHAEVAFTDRWEEDAGRRDFTINALYAEPAPRPGAPRRVWDWHGGLADLAARRVRFIGEPARRIAEDYLRILRFYRFSARFGQALDPEGRRACRQARTGLDRLSRERVRDELLRLLVLPGAPSMVQHMAEDEVLERLLPGASPERLALLARAEAEAGLAPEPLRRLAALVPPGCGLETAERLRLSKAQARRLTAATAEDGPAGPPAVLAWRLGLEPALDRLLLDNRPDEARSLTPWQRPVFPLKGGDLVALGLAPGPEVTRLLSTLEEHWLAQDFQPTRAELLARAAEAAGLRPP